MTKLLMIDDVRGMLKKAVGDSQKAWGARHGISSPYVSDAIAGRADPGEKILAALGLERVVTYRRKPKATRAIERRD